MILSIESGGPPKIGDIYNVKFRKVLTLIFEAL